MTACPLPIDWLDFLEGERAAAMEEHLGTCRSCAELVRRLASVVSKPIAMSPITLGGPRITPLARASVSPGDIWLTSTSFDSGLYRYDGLAQTLVLVLRSVDELGGTRWFDVVPAYIDIESSVPTDVTLEAAESTMWRPLRLDFAQQITVAREQMGSWLGELTDMGDSVLRSVVDGVVDSDRSGPPLEGEDDLRLAARLADAAVIRTLAAPRNRAIFFCRRI